MNTAIVLLVCLTISHAWDSSESSVSEPGEDSDFPYIAAIFLKRRRGNRRSSYSFLCTGSIIDAKWILTGAQCIDRALEKRHNGFFVVVGQEFVAQTSPKHAVADFYMHPDYYHGPTTTTTTTTPAPTTTLINSTTSSSDSATSSDFDTSTVGYDSMENVEVDSKARTVSIVNDVALLELKKELHLNPAVAPVSLGVVDDERLASVIYVEYGSERHHSHKAQRSIIYVMLRTIRFERCSNLLKTKWGLETEKQVCAMKAINGGACIKEYGGILIDSYSRRQVGITSLRPKCSRKTPAVFTRVSEYVPWINNVTGLELEPGYLN